MNLNYSPCKIKFLSSSSSSLGRSSMFFVKSCALLFSTSFFSFFLFCVGGAGGQWLWWWHAQHGGLGYWYLTLRSYVTALKKRRCLSIALFL